MKYTGVLRKMKTELSDQVNYYLDFPSDIVQVHQLLGKNIGIHWKGYECLNCHEDKKIFRQGFCYDCFYNTPKAGDWIMRPELSKAHLNEEDRDLEFEKKMQLQPHVVYLANSSNVKVGVTRKSQIPTRWIDQGAHEAIELVEVPNRYLAGVAEVALKEHLSDKTNWRTMLKNELTDENLLKVKEEVKKYLPEEVLPYYIENTQETNIQFPVLEYPKKLKSLNLTKTPDYEGNLQGIKGQYLIFKDHRVFNVRNHEGFVIALEIL